MSQLPQLISHVKPVRARGKAKRHSKNELAALTSPEALKKVGKEAASDWQKHAPRDYKTILDAKEDT